ncbi:MAG: type II toxin-antitoxin system RelB/DinJ family antitoxin [Sulfurimonas sp.]|jgi:DNA-damage-inducible protein J|nr:type II toxin-antitoxin system RelB/DinJ family antitoxin [Sulfurimonas sp.]
MAIPVSNKVRTNVYLDSTMKEKAKEIFKLYGMGLSDAFNIFLSQSVMEKGIPFQVKIPNKETLEAMQDVESNTNLQEVSFEQLQDDMKQCIAK